MGLPIPFSNPYTYPGHSGVDYPQPHGTPFRASAPGVVTWLGHNRAGGYFIWVQYDGGPKVGYHHMPSHAGCPREGARFKAGDRLGYVGNTGNSTGPHLHSEVEGHRTSDGYWKFFDRNRVVGSGSAAGGSTSTDTPSVVGEEDEGEMLFLYVDKHTKNKPAWVLLNVRTGKEISLVNDGTMVQQNRANTWARVWGSARVVERQDYLNAKDAIAKTS